MPTCGLRCLLAFGKLGSFQTVHIWWWTRGKTCRKDSSHTSHTTSPGHSLSSQDDDQALSRQRTTLEQIKRAANLDDPIILKRNHRNTPEVAAVAEHFHSGRLPTAEVTRESNGELPRLIRSRNIDYTAALVSNWRQTRGGAIGVVVYSNQQTGVELHRKLKERLPESRVDIYQHDEKNEDSTNVLTDGVTVLNKKSVKGQEFDALFILELRRFIPCTNDAERRAMYMMCSRARDNLFLVYGPENLSARAWQALPRPGDLGTTMTNTGGQQALFSGKSGRGDVSRSDPGPAEGCWLGLNTNQRRLFSALQDGWLRPLPPNAGMLLGAGTFVPEQCDGGKQPISVRVKFDVRKLPRLDALAFGDKRWVRWDPNEVELTDFSALYWPGTLPMFAVSALEVATDEEQARLTGMARQFSNVEIPVPVTVGTAAPADLSFSMPPPEAGMELAVPNDSDAIRGSMSMAIWAVPRIDPWLEVLVASLSSDKARLAKSATKVEAGWWRVPPWVTPSADRPVGNLQDGLWRAAVEVFRERSDKDSARPEELAEKIAAVARSHYGSSEVDVAKWQGQTKGILRAETTIQLDDWRDCPVGMTIQLVLTRPEPTNFKTWIQDMPNLPPKVWWSAAALCGLKHGYKKLAIGFRGQAALQEALSVHALRLSNTALRKLHWPNLSGDPSWCREASGFTISWGDRKIDQKPNGSRGQWYAADFGERGRKTSGQNRRETT